MEIPKELSFPVKRALRRLGIGDLTEKEMVLYLSDKRKQGAVSSETAARVADLLRENGFLDDKRYLKNFVRSLDAKLYGPRRVRQELVKHHFPPRYIEAVMNRDVDYSERAVCFLKKKAGSAELCKTPDGRKKLMNALVRYGYDYAISTSAVAEFSGDQELFSE